VVSTLSGGQRKDDFQGVTASTNFPDSSPAIVKPFKEPYERVDEGDPQQKFDPDVGDKFRESICWSNDNKVARGGEWGEFNFEFPAVRCLFDNQGFDSLFEGAKIPAVHVLGVDELFEDFVACAIVVAPLPDGSGRLELDLTF